MSNIFKGLKVITTTPKLEKMMEVAKKKATIKKQSALSSKLEKGQLKKPVIVASRKKLNFYKAQRYGKFDTVPLASKGWQSRMSKGDTFTIQKTSANPAFNFFEDDHRPTFKDLLVDEKIIEQLNQINIKYPTNIQTMAIPSLLTGKNSIVSAETGNGKTMSFLIPIFQNILRKRETKNREREFNAPQALIIAPSRELVHQIKDMARALGANLGLKVSSFIGGGTNRMIENPRMIEMDIMVASLGALSKAVTHNYIKKHNVRHIVMDEADTLLDDSFRDKMLHFLSRFQISDPTDQGNPHESGTYQLILSGATLPSNLHKSLAPITDAGQLQKISTPFLHKLPSHVSHTFYRVGYCLRAAKLSALVKQSINTKTWTIIFCSRNSTAQFVANVIRNEDVPCLLLCSDMPRYERHQSLCNFQEGKEYILVTTDLASRGIDTPLVERVINYDFPSFMSDYIHRSGRVGRVGGKKKAEVINLVEQYNHDLVQKIEYATRKNELLPSVNANIKNLFEMRTEERKNIEKIKQDKLDEEQQDEELKKTLEINT